MLTCTWAPTAFEGHKVVRSDAQSPVVIPSGEALEARLVRQVQWIESLGITHLLVAQRWWGTAQEMEGSTLDCLAMTAFFAAHTRALKLVTAIHPGFFLPAPIAKWGATLDRLTGGRWCINVTSGWHLDEFHMYGAQLLEHDARYERSKEFIDVMRGAWTQEQLSYRGKYYQVRDLRLEPRPTGSLTVFQGGQSDAAIAMAATHSDWMFLNGGAPERLEGLIARARDAAARAGRTLRFAVYAQPLCRDTDDAAWREIDARLSAVDPALVAKRRAATSGAQGMWSADDPLSVLDTNEGFAARLIGSPATIRQRIDNLRRIGVDMLHLDLRDRLFVDSVLPHLTRPETGQ